jgi:L-seryl-tRNA(Ser) seleniumtransferase
MTSLRKLPSIDRLLNATELSPLIATYGPGRIKSVLRDLQQTWRDSGEPPAWLDNPSGYASYLSETLATADYQPIFNLTGTIIHTNLGRALLSAELLEEITPLVTRPMNLEFDLTTGKRGDRDAIVEDRLKLLTGAEAATIVNNGAAALMLVLNTFALGKRVPVSRGELIEIGGSFRLPDIMERSGCKLIEVGTTNRTHLKDFAGAINEDTGMLLKVHPSNYHVAGFTSTVSNSDLAKLGRDSQIPFCVDLGSGSLVDLTRWGLPHEPMPQQLLAQGVDLITFSGDKLLGGMQAGIILGRESLIRELKNNPMKRALRADKLTLAYLSKNLALFEDPERLPERLPLLRTLIVDSDVLRERAEAVVKALEPVTPDCKTTIEVADCQIGSGSLPDQTIDSICVSIHCEKERQLRDLQQQLRQLPTPVIGRLSQGRLWLDMRGAELLDELCVNLRHLGA